MAISDIPQFVRDHYEIHEWRHASAILESDFSQEWNDIMEVLTKFRLYKSHIAVPGGSKSDVAGSLDYHFDRLGWRETQFDTKIDVGDYKFPIIDGVKKRIPELVEEYSIHSPTHQVDQYKNKIAVEVEWNNKDPFYDRDLNNFRLLFELRVISVGVIITRTDELQEIFDRLGRGKSYGASTTHMSKLLPRLEGGGGGGCPVLVFGISNRLYTEDI
ncbi:MAG: BglII/BstYI family type II restriction endonuclease [Anaerolineales bacterium]